MSKTPFNRLFSFIIRHSSGRYDTAGTIIKEFSSTSSHSSVKLEKRGQTQIGSYQRSILTNTVGIHDRSLLIFIIQKRHNSLKKKKKKNCDLFFNSQTEKLVAWRTCASSVKWTESSLALTIIV